MSVAMWNCYSWPLEVSSNVEWPFLTARCKQQCAIAIVDHKMAIAMWNCHCWPLEVSSNVKLPFLTARCKQQCAIAIVDHKMAIAMWNCHSWPLDVSSNVNHLTVLYGPSLQTFITQSVICCKCQFQMEGTSAKEGLSTKFELILGLTLASQRSFLWKTNKAFLLYSWGSICQSIVLCQCWWIGIQGISTLLPRGVHMPKYTSLPSFVY